MTLSAEMEEMRRYVKNVNTVNDTLLEKGEIEKHLEQNKTSLTMKILEAETKQQKSLTETNEYFNMKLNSLQDQISNSRLTCRRHEQGLEERGNQLNFGKEAERCLGENPVLGDEN